MKNYADYFGWAVESIENNSAEKNMVVTLTGYPKHECVPFSVNEIELERNINNRMNGEEKEFETALMRRVTNTMYGAYSNNVNFKGLITPKIKNLIFNPPATIVFWTDGTETVVKCQNQVYTCDFKTPSVIGLPQIVFADERTVDFAKYRDPFRLLDTCKKLPKVIFEYDCMCWYGNSYNLKLLEDGRLVRLAYGYSKLGPQDRIAEDKEYILLNSPELVKEIKQLIKDNRDELKKTPKEVSNFNVMDGAGETFRFGRLKIYGSNALSYSMENYKEELERWNAVEVGWEEPLLQFQKLFKKFQDKFHEYFELPLFNGEFNEGAD